MPVVEHQNSTKYIQSYQDLYFLTICYCQDIFKNTSLDFGQKGIPGPGIQLMNPEANAHSMASDDDTSKCFIFCSFPGKDKLDNFAGQIPLSHWVVEKLMEKLENVPQQNLNSQDFGIWKWHDMTKSDHSNASLGITSKPFGACTRNWHQLQRSTQIFGVETTKWKSHTQPQTILEKPWKNDKK